MTESSLLTWKLFPRVLMDMKFGGWNWRSSGAVAGICLGIISPLIGGVFTVISWFTGARWHGLAVQRYGTVLLFLTIPLLAFGAHCLDLAEKRNTLR